MYWGGDCLVSLAPFSWLNEKYTDKLGILWIDSHPDVQTPVQYKNAHSHVLGALMGNSDTDFISTVKLPVYIRHWNIRQVNYFRYCGLNQSRYF
ncbi:MULTISPECIES: arginase family protein [Xenorhabdus]|uniref:arginase family protein n=1 Tax=Xenorhabdus TaxID=626 RepID=UPI00350F885E